MVLQDISLLSKISFGIIALSLILLLIGIGLAKKELYLYHKWMMILASITSSLFVVFYVVRFIREGDTKFQGSTLIRDFIYFPILIIHILFATISIYLVPKHLYNSFKNLRYSDHSNIYFENNYNHTKIGTKAATFWAISFIGGISVFVLLYFI